jgi:hypothetical protein
MRYPIERPQISKAAVLEKWVRFLEYAYEARIGKVPKPPLVTLKYRLNGTVETLPSINP